MPMPAPNSRSEPTRSTRSRVRSCDGEKKPGRIRWEVSDIPSFRRALILGTPGASVNDPHDCLASHQPIPVDGKRGARGQSVRLSREGGGEFATLLYSGWQPGKGSPRP